MKQNNRREMPHVPRIASLDTGVEWGKYVHSGVVEVSEIVDLVSLTFNNVDYCVSALV